MALTAAPSNNFASIITTLEFSSEVTFFNGCWLSPQTHWVLDAGWMWLWSRVRLLSKMINGHINNVRATDMHAREGTMRIFLMIVN